jgi:hypothetical protein
MAVLIIAVGSIRPMRVLVVRLTFLNKVQLNEGLGVSGPIPAFDFGRPTRQ